MRNKIWLFFLCFFVNTALGQYYEVIETATNEILYELHIQNDGVLIVGGNNYFRRYSNKF